MMSVKNPCGYMTYLSPYILSYTNKLMSTNDPDDQ